MCYDGKAHELEDCLLQNTGDMKRQQEGMDRTVGAEEAQPLRLKALPWHLPQLVSEARLGHLP